MRIRLARLKGRSPAIAFSRVETLMRASTARVLREMRRRAMVSRMRSAICSFWSAVNAMSEGVVACR
jgi:hypothetical protein